MCGIFAIINYIESKKLDEAIKNGVYRGPEKYSNFIKNNLHLHFHRLAINGLNDNAMQPLVNDGIYLICNGEIYNYHCFPEFECKTDSDCEIIIHLYKKYGMEKTLTLLDGVYAFILYDSNQNIIYAARDVIGVRPLYSLQQNKTFMFASDLKVLHPMLTENDYTIEYFKPGTYSVFKKTLMDDWELVQKNISYYELPTLIVSDKQYNMYLEMINNKLHESVKKRVVDTSDRPIACLLSGGLDSSTIAALVKKYYKNELETYSIGMKGSEDLMYAEKVAKHIGTKHTSIVLTKQDFFDAIPEVIQMIESYDVTTVRASVGNYLVGKYISENSDAKVIFNGDGSDEITGGYIYMLKAPSDEEFDKECRRLIKEIYKYDVLRSDKSISSNGLEPRTPFLDKGFIETYMSIPVKIRKPKNNEPEKYLLRTVIEKLNPELLPKEVLWRQKEAFSDGVSGENESWYQVINDFLNGKSEKEYYKKIFMDNYNGFEGILEYYWMPKYVNATDASARTLEHY